MRASDVIKILSVCPDAEVSVYSNDIDGDDICDINITITVVNDEMAFCIDRA